MKKELYFVVFFSVRWHDKWKSAKNDHVDSRRILFLILSRYIIESKESTKNNSCVNKIYISCQEELYFVVFLQRWYASDKNQQNIILMWKKFFSCQEELYFVDFLPLWWNIWNQKNNFLLFFIWYFMTREIPKKRSCG